MPGYYIHLAAGKCLLDLTTPASRFHEKKVQNEFLVGCLLPDIMREKAFSHFRKKEYQSHMIEYPQLDVFLQKYQGRLSEAVIMGYFYHLYVDERFFREYIPQIASFLDEHGNETIYRGEVQKVLIKKSGKKIPLAEHLSESYYYGDYSKLGQWLKEQYQLPKQLDFTIPDPQIDEIDITNLARLEQELEGFAVLPVEAADQLKVMEKDDIAQLMNLWAMEFYHSWKEQLEEESPECEE